MRCVYIVRCRRWCVAFRHRVSLCIWRASRASVTFVCWLHVLPARVARARARSFRARARVARARAVASGVWRRRQSGVALACGGGWIARSSTLQCARAALSARWRARLRRWRRRRAAMAGVGCCIAGAQCWPFAVAVFGCCCEGGRTALALAGLAAWWWLKRRWRCVAGASARVAAIRRQGHHRRASRWCACCVWRLLGGRGRAVAVFCGEAACACAFGGGVCVVVRMVVSSVLLSTVVCRVVLLRCALCRAVLWCCVKRWRVASSGVGGRQRRASGVPSVDRHRSSYHQASRCFTVRLCCCRCGRHDRRCRVGVVAGVRRRGDRTVVDDGR